MSSSLAPPAGVDAHVERLIRPDPDGGKLQPAQRNRAATKG
jgi:hypothetical protein